MTYSTAKWTIGCWVGLSEHEVISSLSTEWQSNLLSHIVTSTILHHHCNQSMCRVAENKVDFHFYAAYISIVRHMRKAGVTCRPHHHHIRFLSSSSSSAILHKKGWRRVVSLSNGRDLPILQPLRWSSSHAVHSVMSSVQRRRWRPRAL